MIFPPGICDGYLSVQVKRVGGLRYPKRFGEHLHTAVIAD